MLSLKLALLHSAPTHKQTDANRAQLLALFRRACEAGAQLIAAPEMAVSGYSFSGRRDIAPYVETADGPTLTALAELAREYGVYACLGLAERDPRTSIFYNSAFALNPQGNVVCRHRKINAEHRWACPGNPLADNTFATPWGRVGLLICSDSYHSLMPRVTALRGADLLLIPANWPPTGLDPREIWRARALENGMYVAACNRTGMDLTMDCRQGASAAFDPHGNTLLDHSSPHAQLTLTDLPLDDHHRLTALTGERLQGRLATDVSDCCLNLSGISDLTSFLRLPLPGPLALSCHAAESEAAALAALERSAHDNPDSRGLHILPAGVYSNAALDRMGQLSATAGAIVFLMQGQDAGWRWCEHGVWTRPASYGGVLAQTEYGAARILLASLGEFRRPEPILAAAKRGCDLVIASGGHLTDEDRLLAGVRTIDAMAAAACAANGSGIWMTPEGHQRWEEVLAGPGEPCDYLLDTRRTRNKRFQDRVDYDRLLATEPSP